MNSTAASRTVIRAAAGTGKTARLTQEYLSFLSEGYAVSEIVAITFTRKAAAELTQRISDVLWALKNDGSMQCGRAGERLGDDLEKLYRTHAPRDGKVITRALADLGGAPIGTIDSFVSRLVAQFALHARLPVDAESFVPLDYPLGEGAIDHDAVFRDEARALIAPPNREISREVLGLLRYYSLEQLLDLVATPRPDAMGDALPASFDEVFQALSGGLAAAVEGGLDGLKSALIFALELEFPVEKWPDRLNPLVKPKRRGDADEWEARIEKATNKPGKPFVRAVANWLTGEGKAPAELVAWIGSLNSTCQGRLREHMAKKPDPQSPLGSILACDLGLPVKVAGDTVIVPLDELADGFPGRFVENDDYRRILEEVRRGVDGLRKAVTRRATERIAREGSLDNDHLLKAATALCSREEAPLRGRFKALLVDEVQDSSPEQLEFYRAFCLGDPALHARFVGDTRQSIYLFRGAEPSGLDLLAGDIAQGSDSLVHNYRSFANLVFAHRSLFGQDGHLPEVVRSRLLSGLERLDESTLMPGLEEAGDERPVILVVPNDKLGKMDSSEADTSALLTFTDKVIDAWNSGKGKPATAAVLAPTWKLACQARDVINARLAEENKEGNAFVDGGGNWARSREVEDLRILLAALVDRSNQTAWLGVWKHPMVGLSDRALALVRSGRGLVKEDGPAPGWVRHLGWLAEADRLEHPHDETDIRAFAYAKDALKKASRSIGAVGVAETMEELARALHWRELLAAGPDEEALVRLDLALDWIRGMDTEGSSAVEIIDVLGGEKDAGEIPRLELYRPDRHISCTTIYQAKGLKWDHVCVLSPGTASRGGGRGKPDLRDAFLEIDIDGKRFWLEPMRFDPGGAFDSIRDPIDKLRGLIETQRKREEELRLTYVAVTRATRQVVMGLQHSKQQKKKSIHGLLCEAWVEKGRGERPKEDGTVEKGWDSNLFGVSYICLERPMSAPFAVQLGYVRPGEEKLKELLPSRSSWQRRAPSSLHAALEAKDRKALAAAAAVSALEGPGALDLGLGEPREAPEVEGCESYTETDWGSLVHGWFARWHFSAKPRGEMVDDACAYVCEEWDPNAGDEKARAIAEWLATIGLGLAEKTDSALWRLVTSGESRLAFELPLTGVARIGELSEREFLLSGQADLLVEEPGGLWTVIDFKAGSSSPLPGEEPHTPERLAREAKLATYGPQLEGYARALNRAFASMQGRESHRVHRLALWFVRTGASVIWQPLG